MKMLKLSALLLVAGAAVNLSHAQSTWTGAGADQNWSTPGNWSGGVIPNNTTVTFPDGAFPVTTNTQGVVNNIVQSSTTISSLTYNNLINDFDTTQIPSGTTLTVAGNLTVGASDGTTANKTTVTMTGGGSLIAGSGASTLSGQSGTGSQVSVLDLSGLSSFVFNPAGTGGSFNLGTGSSGAAVNMTLAANSNAITVGTFNIGNNNTRGVNTVTLGGGTNIIFADTINMGFSKTAGTLQFASPGSGLTIANRAGTGRSTINISGEANSGSTTTANNAFMFLDGGPVNILAGTITIGNRQARASAAANGTLAFDNGVVDATAINMGINLSGGGAANGTVAVGGTGTLKVANSISLVNQGGTAGTGSLIVTNGGTVICSGNIFKTTSIGIGVVSVADSTLVVGGTIGVSNGIPVDNFNITNATLTLPAVGVGLPAISAVNFSPDFTTTSNIINIASLPAISSFPTQLPIIMYTAPAGNLDTMVLGTLPQGFSGYISNNVNGASIDLVLTNGPSAKADTWRGNVNSLWDTTTLNWQTNGVAANYNDLDQVTFDDTAVTGQVTVTGVRTPATVNGLTFNNNTLSYVLSGSGKISGPAQLIMNGSGSVTLSETGGDNFSGGIVVNAGTLILDNTNSAITGGLTIASGTTVQIGNNDACGTLPGGTIANDGTLVFRRTNNLSIGTVIPGGGSLVQIGTGTLTLTANETYSGNTTVGAGTLALSGGGSLANSAQVTVTNATLDVSGVTAATASLTTLNMTNSALNVKVGYLQTNLNVSSLNLGGTSNLLNIISLPPIASYPSTNVLVQSPSPITGYNFVRGSLPAATPSYVGTIALSPDGTSVLLTLTAGPIGVRPSVTWSGADALVNTNWSDALNWQTPGVPAPSEPVTFNNTAPAGGTPFDVIGDGHGGILTPANINNAVDVNITNASLTYANNGGTFQNTLIAPTKTLTVNGSLVVNGSGGDTTILGAGGTLKVNNPSNSTALTVQGGTAPVLDMSGLDTFIGNVNQFSVGANPANSATLVSGTVYLAKTNLITTGSGFSGTSAAMIVGSGNSGATGLLYLGQTNAIYVDGITMGINISGNDLIAFNPSFANSSAYIRGNLGDSSRVTLWSLGDNTINLNNTTPSGNLTNDFSGGTLNALVNTLAIGQGSQGNTLPVITPKGVFNMGPGVLNVTTLKVGSAGSGNPGGAGVGIMNVMGGTVIANTLGLPASTFATGGGVTATTGTLSLTNATLIVSNSLTVAPTSGGGTLNLVTSTMKLLNGTAGTSTAPLVALTIDGSTIQLPVDGSTGLPVVTATTITTGAPTTINIGSIANVTAPMQVPLIAYTGTDPFASLTRGTAPAGYTVDLVDNAGAGTIDLSITPTGVTSTPRITSISISGATLNLSATNGNSNGQFALLSTTNIALPINQWTPVLTNNFDSSGNVTLSTNVINSAVPRQFYLLQALP